MLHAVFRNEARHEFDEAALWYEERRVGLGIEFVHEVDRAVEAVTKAPLQFPVVHRDIRCVRVRRFPYSLFFRVEEREILVLAVFHAKRSPTTWRDRK